MTKQEYVIPVTEDELQALATGLGVSASSQRMSEEELERTKDLMKRLFMLWAENQRMTKSRAESEFEDRWKQVMDLRESELGKRGV